MDVYLSILTAVFALGTIVEQDTEKGKVLGKCFYMSILLMSVMNLFN